MNKKENKTNLQAYSFLLPNLIFYLLFVLLSCCLGIKICILSVWSAMGTGESAFCRLLKKSSTCIS